MKIDIENDYYKQANLDEGRKLAKKYMKKAIAEVPNVIGDGVLLSTRKHAAQVVQKFFHEKYIEAVYVYEKDGGWYGDIMCERDDETYTFGTPNDQPHGTEQEAIDNVIHVMADVIAVGQGKKKSVDKSGVPDGYIDFRLYTQTYVLPMSTVTKVTNAIAIQKIMRGCTTNDVRNESRDVIHDEMSKPAFMRNNSFILDRMLALIGCDVYMVNYPVGWDGDPFDMPVFT